MFRVVSSDESCYTLCIMFYYPTFFLKKLISRIVILLQIGVLIEDKEFVDSFMGGKPRKAGKFASTLRLSLWSEHLGLRTGEVLTYS